MIDHGDDLLDDLVEALRLSPDNVTLRDRVGDLMLRRGRLDEAEAVYREGVKLAPASERLQLGMARCAYRQGRNSEAIVIVESLVKRPGCGGAALLLLARLMIRSGEVDRAAEAYRRAVDLDPDLAEEELEETLGIARSARKPAGEYQEHEADEEGRLLAINAPGEERPGRAELERPQITFSDVGGMEDLKDQVRMKIIHPQAHAAMFAAYGKAVGGGLLLYGPPGCGKTYLARATAGEVKAGFIAVGIHEVLDMYIGQSEQRLHAIFDQARQNAPCVLFFDEVDALGASRTDLRHSAGRHLINQFLAELDGVQSSNEGVLVLGATNAPWHLDPAFRRPGRFDQVIFVPPPDEAGRAAILRVLLRGRPVKDIDHESIARRTERFSGADLKVVVDQAVEQKLKEAMKTGRPEPLGTRDLLAQAKTRKPSTAEWFATARNYALFANESGAYDAVLDYLNRR